jgi:hypothetical protein
MSKLLGLALPLQGRFRARLGEHTTIAVRALFRSSSS